jgi:hypothetical protein
MASGLADPSQTANNRRRPEEKAELFCRANQLDGFLSTLFFPANSPAPTPPSGLLVSFAPSLPLFLSLCQSGKSASVALAAATAATIVLSGQTDQKQSVIVSRHPLRSMILSKLQGML